LSAVASQNPDSLIPLGYTVFDHGYDLSYNFLYKFQITSVNAETGNATFDYMAVGSDRQLTFNEAQDLMSTLFTGEYTQKGYNVESIDLDAAFGRPELE
jgi:hypothetical protein